MRHSPAASGEPDTTAASKNRRTARKVLERFKKYFSHSWGRRMRERSFWVLASFRLGHRFFKHAPSPKPRQKLKNPRSERPHYFLNRSNSPLKNSRPVRRSPPVRRSLGEGGGEGGCPRCEGFGSAARRDERAYPQRSVSEEQRRRRAKDPQPPAAGQLGLNVCFDPVLLFERGCRALIASRPKLASAWVARVF